MENKKIAIVIQIEEGDSIDETVRFLAMQQLPENIEPELYTVESSEINELMTLLSTTGASCVIIIDCATLLINPYTLNNFLAIFDFDENIGMVGISGNTVVPYDGIFWKHRNLGKIGRLKDAKDVELQDVYVCNDENVQNAAFLGHECYAVKDIKVLKKALFMSKEFWPILIGFETLKAGKRVVVPKQEKNWCIKMSSDIDINQYLNDRAMIYEKYSRFFEMQT